jgi:hypothetical protein
LKLHIFFYVLREIRDGEETGTSESGQSKACQANAAAFFAGLNKRQYCKRIPQPQEAKKQLDGYCDYVVPGVEGINRGPVWPAVPT